MSSPLPKWDRPRLCGGAVITGTKDGGFLWVDTMNGNKNAISAMEELRIKYGETTPVIDPVVWLLAHEWLARRWNMEKGIGKDCYDG